MYLSAARLPVYTINGWVSGWTDGWFEGLIEINKSENNGRPSSVEG